MSIVSMRWIRSEWIFYFSVTIFFAQVTHETGIQNIKKGSCVTNFGEEIIIDMKLTPQQIAEAFSAGRFEITYVYLANDIQWNIVGDKKLEGKEAVIKFCEQTASYFLEVTTYFKMSNLVVSDNCVAIDGTAIFINKENKKTFVSSCDVYSFNNDKLISINSYCITTGRE